MELLVNMYIIVGLLVVYYIGDNKNYSHNDSGYYQEKERKTLEVFELLFIFYLWPIYLTYKLLNKKDKKI